MLDPSVIISFKLIPISLTTITTTAIIMPIAPLIITITVTIAIIIITYLILMQ